MDPRVVVSLDGGRRYSEVKQVPAPARIANMRADSRVAYALLLSHEDSAVPRYFRGWSKGRPSRALTAWTLGAAKLFPSRVRGDVYGMTLVRLRRKGWAIEVVTVRLDAKGWVVP